MFAVFHGHEMVFEGGLSQATAYLLAHEKTLGEAIRKGWKIIPITVVCGCGE